MGSLFSLEYLKNLIFWIPVILLSISFHEYSHGYIAYKLGDPTAKNEGRLTLNPIKHFNLFGFLMMLIIHFGWATPVPVNPGYFKNPKKGMLLTALAGPISNMILAIVGTLLYTVCIVVTFFTGASISEFMLGIIQNSQTIFLYLIYINLGLAIFNLIPVYPLDGSRILGYFMPVSYHVFMQKYGQYIQIGFMILVLATPYVGNFVSVVETSLARLLTNMWLSLFQLIINLF